MASLFRSVPFRACFVTCGPLNCLRSEWERGVDRHGERAKRQEGKTVSGNNRKKKEDFFSESLGVLGAYACQAITPMHAGKSPYPRGSAPVIKDTYVSLFDLLRYTKKEESAREKERRAVMLFTPSFFSMGILSSPAFCSNLGTRWGKEPMGLSFVG